MSDRPTIGKMRAVLVLYDLVDDKHSGSKHIGIMYDSLRSIMIKLVEEIENE